MEKPKNNRLKFNIAYLVGPMDHDRHSGREWRKEMTTWLKKRRILPIDPYHKPLMPIHQAAHEGNDDWFEERQQAKKNHDYQKVREIMKPIVHTDLRIVDKADFLIVHMDKEKYPCGSFDEIVTAANQNKPIIIHCPYGVHEMYDWMFGRIPHQLFFNTWEEIKEYIRHIDEDPDEEINLLNRWKFFNLEPLILEAML